MNSYGDIDIQTTDRRDGSTVVSEPLLWKTRATDGKICNYKEHIFNF